MTQHPSTHGQRAGIGLLAGLTLAGAAGSFLAFDVVSNVVGTGLATIPGRATMIQQDIAPVLAGLGAVLASALAVPAAVHALTATSVRKGMRPWPFGAATSPSASMAMSVQSGCAGGRGGRSPGFVLTGA